MYNTKQNDKVDVVYYGTYTRIIIIHEICTGKNDNMNNDNNWFQGNIIEMQQASEITRPATT